MVIEGLTFSQVQTALGATAISSLSTSSAISLTTLKNYAGQLPDGALATLYTYYPSVGVASETQPNGYTLPASKMRAALSRLMSIIMNEAPPKPSPTGRA